MPVPTANASRPSRTAPAKSAIATCTDSGRASGSVSTSSSLVTAGSFLVVFFFLVAFFGLPARVSARPVVVW